MNKTIIIIIFIATVLLDLISTYYAAPNLIGEQNVIVKQFGAGWFGFIFSQICVVAFYLWLFIKSFNPLTNYSSILFFFFGRLFVYSSIIIRLYLIITNFLIGFYLKTVFNASVTNYIKQVIIFEQNNNIILILKFIIFTSLSIYLIRKIFHKKKDNSLS